MGVVLCVANHKGGVGKTTVVVNLGWEFSKKYKTLLIDADPQGNATTHLGVQKRNTQLTVASVILGECVNPLDAVQAWSDNLYILPANTALYELTVNDPTCFAKRLEIYRDYFDFIVVDCAPSMSSITMGVFCFADYLITPIECGFLGLEGLTDLLKTIHHVKAEYLVSIELLAVVFNMVDRRNNLSGEIYSYLKKQFRSALAKTVIPRNIKVAEAPSHGLPVAQYSPSCVAALAFKQLAQEIVKKVAVANLEHEKY
ncbi:MAG: ParA family protein [Gammaproteobacteria bacterium]|nr:ParA family protein [Gammaproteobacteria bacterium]